VIYGIGVDLVEVERMQANLDRFGRRFASRILTAEELDEFSEAPHPGRFLAKRFAAKEAAAKAFGTGFRNGLWFCHIGVAHEGQGRPVLRYYGPALELAERCGIAASHLSITDERAHAIAFVTLVCDKP